MNKMLWIVASFLFAGAAHAACPNLTGTYECKYEDGSVEEKVISQEEVNGVTLYTENGGEGLPADNQTRALPDEDGFRNGSLRAWCEAESLKVNMIGDIYDHNEPAGAIDVVLTYGLDASSNMTQVVTGTFKTVQGEFDLGGTITCTRK